MSSRRCCERPAPADVVSSTMPLSFSQIRQSFVISAHQPHPRRFHHHTFPSLFRSWLKTFLCMDTGTFRTALTDNRTAYRTFIIGFRFIFFLTFSLHCYSFSVPVASPFHFVLSGSHSSLSIPRSALYRSPPSKKYKFGLTPCARTVWDAYDPCVQTARQHCSRKRVQPLKKT